MMTDCKRFTLPSLSKVPALLLIGIGGLFALYYLIFEPSPYQSIDAALFLDPIAIPFDWVQIGPVSFPLQVDDLLVFQEFKALSPDFKITESLAFSLLAWLIAVSALTLITTFKKTYFVLAGVAWILLLTISNLNGLNIGGLNSNYPLIILLFATLSPMVYFHVWGTSIRFWIKWTIMFLFTVSSLAVMITLSPITQPAVYIAEHSLMLGLGLAVAWIFWNGHSLLSGIYILLARSNRHLHLKISWQISIISILYLTVLLFILMDLKGDKNLPFPTFSPLYLILPIGILGWYSMQEKSRQTQNPICGSWVLDKLYLLGFAIALWLVWKLKLSGNQPAEEFYKHLITYTQIGFSLFFFIYLLSNFLSVMDSGKAVDQILYKPYSLPYYHIRIGGLIAMLVLITYAEGVIAVQANTMSTNILADYYYHTGKKLEASILYENAWARYRKNPKAKFTAAQLLLELKQPTLAKQHLEQSFAEAPQVDNILLLSDRLHAENRIFEAVYYLERGRGIFPENPYLLNNLALLYAKLDRKNEAISLLQANTAENPVVLSNLNAMKSKMGRPEESENVPSDLPSLLNKLVSANLLGNLSPKPLMSSVRKKLQTETSPMLIHAGYRNLWSEKNNTDPEKDLALLDSLSKLDVMADYLMQLQETAVIRSLGAGRVTEAIKNLNGLAFRNPGDAGYYLQLSASILAQNLDFKKSAAELLAAEEKGFKGFRSHHWSIFGLGGMPDKSEEIRENYNIAYPSYVEEGSETTRIYLEVIAGFHETLPERLWKKWSLFPENELKTDLAIRIIRHKAHGLSQGQLSQLASHIAAKIGAQDELDKFVSNPDLRNLESVEALMDWLDVGDELTGNPYLTPLVLSAAEVSTDVLTEYEILNAASEFNRDPLLWVSKVSAARKVGLENYANEALEQMRGWISEEELEAIQMSNF